MRKYSVLIVLLVQLLGGDNSCLFGAEPDRPETYPTELPLAERFCVPVRAMFAEANRTESWVRGRTIRHQANGGFGLAIEQPGAGRNLVHTGADVGWGRIREPVFAIADGIVRQSHGPKFKKSGENETVRTPPGQLPWGNLIVIEHRIGEASFITSVYGHLGGDRRVEVGDTVKVGQPIGTIGRKHLRINGGYDPHLHFGIRIGRNGEIGESLLDRSNGWNGPPVSIVSVNGDTMELSCEAPITRRWNLFLGERRWQFTFVDGAASAPASMLWDWQRPNFAIEGYALTTDGWHDPVKFLRQHNAASNPSQLVRRRGRR